MNLIPSAKSWDHLITCEMQALRKVEREALGQSHGEKLESYRSSKSENQVRRGPVGIAGEDALPSVEIFLQRAFHQLLDHDRASMVLDPCIQESNDVRVHATLESVDFPVEHHIHHRGRGCS